MKNALTLEAFADFCERKGDEIYNYEDHDNCAVAQYAKSLGVSYSVAAVNVCAEAPRDFWGAVEYAAVLARPRTFASLAKFIREEML